VFAACVAASVILSLLPTPLFAETSPSAAVAAATTLVPRGATWKYSDTGTNFGFAWSAPAFNDSAWRSGPAQLGYGDGDEQTVVSYGPSAINKYITTYFRRSFTVANPAAIAVLTLRVLRDDGCLVYLNGTEVLRSNMPSRAISFFTYASTAVEDNTWHEGPVAPSLLVAGTNVLAVEVHQASANSPDLSFDLELVSGSPPHITKGPYLQQVTRTSVVVMWETDVAAASRVDYGLSSPDQLSVADATAVTIHEMQITGLAAGTTYRYNVSSDDTTSSNSTFTTAPVFSQPYRLVVYGDSRSNPSGHASVVAGIIKSDPDLVLHTGDLVLTGDPSEFGPQFFAPAHNLMLNTPLLPSLGNHENNSAAYYSLFSLPGIERWYAFTYGCARILCLDTNANFSPGSAQHDWLVSELTSPEYASSTWQFVVLHHPPYTATVGHSDDLDVQQYLVPLFEQHGVDVVFAGHSHAYERYSNNGIVYIVTGGGGAPLYKLDVDTVPPFRVAGASTSHHVVVDVTTISARLSARNNSAKEFDRIEIFTPNEPPVAVPDGHSTDEDLPLSVPAPGVLANDSDPDNNPLRAILVGGVSHGTLLLNPDGSFVYLPDANFHGADSFTYKANDLRADSPAVTVDIVVNSVNDPPVAGNDAALIEQDTAIGLAVLANDSDVDGDVLAIDSITQPTHGGASHDGVTVTYTPTPGYAGPDAFTYTVGDGNGGTATATVTILVTPHQRPDIHGRITDAAGNGVAGVTLKVQGRAGLKWKGTAITDASGFYSVGNLPLGTYNIKPSLKKWKFTPKSLDVSLTAPTDHVPANFSGVTK